MTLGRSPPYSSLQKKTLEEIPQKGPMWLAVPGHPARDVASAVGPARVTLIECGSNGLEG